jgi:hypothetical protein
MSLTLVEAAKLYDGDPLRSAIIELYARSSDILRVLPFQTIKGSALRYNQEQTLPGIGFRGVNEAFTESTGIINPVTEPLVIAGGDLDVDNFILDTMGADQRETHEAMKMKALALSWTKTFIKGDQSITVREFDGLQARVAGSQLIVAGSTSGGDALSLAKMDESIDACDNPSHILMNKAMRRRFSTAARTSSISGDLRWEKDEFGVQIAYYNDLPIVIVDQDNEGSDIMAFDEAPSGGGSSVSTSIYILSLGDGKLAGIQGDNPEARDLGELQTKSAKRTRVEWYSGIAVFHPKAAVRLYGITNAAITA